MESVVTKRYDQETTKRYRIADEQDIEWPESKTEIDVKPIDDGWYLFGTTRFAPDTELAPIHSCDENDQDTVKGNT